MTFFFNGGVETPNENEDRFLIPSPKVATYDLKPEMSAPEVCTTLIEKIRSQQYDCILINFANPDMVGHTGVMDAVVKAIETIDGCVRQVVDVILEVDGTMFLCADHGNAEELINPETGEPWTAHTTNPVPFILVSDRYKNAKLKDDGTLANVAPTVLELMNIEKPNTMLDSMILK